MATSIKIPLLIKMFSRLWRLVLSDRLTYCKFFQAWFITQILQNIKTTLGKINSKTVKLNMATLEMRTELSNRHVVVKWVAFRSYCTILKLATGSKVIRGAESQAKAINPLTVEKLNRRLISHAAKSLSTAITSKLLIVTQGNTKYKNLSTLQCQSFWNTPVNNCR